MFFLAQEDDVTCFDEVKQRLPESFHEKIKNSSMLEGDLIAIMGEMMNDAPADMDLTGDIAGMKDQLASYLSKKGWDTCGRLVHYEPDSPHYLP